MNQAKEELIHRLMPTYDEEPPLLKPEDVERLTNGALKVPSLAADRVGARRHGLEFTKIGRRIRYLKSSVADFLVRSYVGSTATGGGR